MIVVYYQKIFQQNEQHKEDSLGLSRIRIKDGIAAGIIAIIVAILWFIVGLLYLDRIFIYPAILVGLGIFTIVKGINKRKKINFLTINYSILSCK